MQGYSLGRAKEQAEFGFGTPGLTLYPDTNTLFDVEANNDWCAFFTTSQFSLLLEVRHYALGCHNSCPKSFMLVCEIR